MRIVIENLSFEYTRGAPVFEGLNLEITRFPVAVLGPNGAGKSTLLALLAGRMAPKKGAIDVKPENGSDGSNSRQLRQLTSWMPQETKPLRGLSVREYIAYSGWLKGMRYRAAWRSARSAMRAVDLIDHAKASVNHLSGGQRRRLGIASALVSAPSLLILDEPYAGLDPEQRGIVRTTIRQLRGETALVVSTHQTEDLIDIYGSVIVIDHGRVLFNGTSEEFIADIPIDVSLSDQVEYAYRRATQKVTSEAGG